MTPADGPQGTVMYKVGVVVIVLVALYWLFMAVNTVGLAEQTATASVVGKAYKEPGKSYVTQVIDGRSYVRPQVTPEAYLVNVTIDGREVTAQVNQASFEAVQDGDQVQVVYVKRRLTGALQIVRVNR